MPTNYRGTSQERFALDAMIKLERSSSSLLKYLEHSGVLGDLTQSQFGVLDLLFHLGSQPQKMIAEKMFKSAGTITFVVDNLEKKGLVLRSPNQNDRRLTNVSLTEKGFALAAEILPAYVDVVVEATRELSTIELDTLGKLCKKLGLSLVDRTK